MEPEGAKLIVYGSVTAVNGTPATAGEVRTTRCCTAGKPSQAASAVARGARRWRIRAGARVSTERWSA